MDLSAVSARTCLYAVATVLPVYCGARRIIRLGDWFMASRTPEHVAGMRNRKLAQANLVRLEQRMLEGWRRDLAVVVIGLATHYFLYEPSALAPHDGWNAREPSMESYYQTMSLIRNLNPGLPRN